MALKDKLMTLEDFKAVRDVDVASNSAQFTEIKADLDAIRESSTTINMCDDEALESRSGITYSDGVFTGKASDFNPYVLLNTGFESGKRYTVSFYGQNTGSNVSGNGLGVRIDYTDESYVATYLPNSTSEYSRYVVTSGTGKTVSSIRLTYNSGGANVWNIKEIQIEEGTTATDYVQHIITTAFDQTARHHANLNELSINNLETITVQASQERIDSHSKYQSFNDLPVGKIVNLFSSIKLADGPQGYNPIGHNNSNDGNYNATVLTYSAETDPRAIVQVCIFYVSGGFTHDKEPRTATRYAIKTNGTIVWSDWSIMSSNMVLHSTDKVVDVNSYSTVTFSDFNDAEPNGIYQVDLNVGTTILNNPSPGHSGLLMTFSFSPVTHHALVQNFYALETTGIEMYFRYSYKQSANIFAWTPWKKVSASVI